ncbi:MAG: dipeptide/tripeptide permease [Candidatus Nanohaloarchaea archaeon]|jgi:dipeptide/tripeptide permease
MATVFSVALGIVAAVLGMTAGLIIFKLGRDKETAMTKMKLKNKDSRMDFRLFFYVNLLMTGSALLYWIGVILNQKSIVIINQYSVVFYGVFLTMLFMRWWRRF